MNKTQEQLVYAVLVLRTDQNHITVLESDNYDKCFKIWTELSEKWEECARESKPFSMITPIVTAFSPGMITEITIMPVTNQETAAKQSNNPYYNNMVQNGFANTAGQGFDMLDQGFKR